MSLPNAKLPQTVVSFSLEDFIFRQMVFRFFCLYVYLLVGRNTFIKTKRQLYMATEGYLIYRYIIFASLFTFSVVAKRLKHVHTFQSLKKYLENNRQKRSIK